MFLVSLEGLEFKIDEEFRLGTCARVRDFDIERYRSIIYMLLFSLHPFEASLLYLYLFKKKTQDDIAKLFGITQGAVSSRLSKAAKRLKFISSLPNVPKGVLEALVSEFIQRPLWVKIVVLMIDQTSHSAVARILNRPQGSVRQAFLASIDRLKNVLAELEAGETIFPSRNLLKVYLRSTGTEEKDLVHDEVVEWVKDNLSKVVQLLELVRENYSILSIEKLKAPRLELLRLG